MRACKRILAGLVLLLSAAGLLLSLAAGAGVWVVKGPVTDKATHTFARVEAALDVADQGLEHARTSLDRAVERLDAARAEEKQRAAASKPGRARRLVARTLQQQLAPEVGNAHEKLHTVAEAAVLVNTVLEDLGNFPLLSRTGLDLDGLAELNGRLGEVAPRAWELSRLLGESGAPAPDADTQLSRIDRALKTMRAKITEYEAQVASVRQRTEQLKSQTLPWITPAAILVSLVCFWVALSQLSLLCRAWSWLRG
jgi:hypothetical protein